MQPSIKLPIAFSVSRDNELSMIQDILTRLNHELIVVQVATGLHIDGGSTVNWGLVYHNAQSPTEAEVRAALEEAGLDLQHNAEIQPLRIWVENQPPGHAGG
jgi:hypothetical protein